MIKNVNTIEEYKNIDKAKVLNLAGQMVHRQMKFYIRERQSR